jgi:hypothetical protein
MAVRTTRRRDRVPRLPIFPGRSDRVGEPSGGMGTNKLQFAPTADTSALGQAEVDLLRSADVGRRASGRHEGRRDPGRLQADFRGDHRGR